MFALFTEHHFEWGSRWASSPPVSATVCAIEVGMRLNGGEEEPTGYILRGIFPDYETAKLYWAKMNDTDWAEWAQNWEDKSGWAEK